MLEYVTGGQTIIMAGMLIITDTMDTTITELFTIHIIITTIILKQDTLQPEAHREEVPAMFQVTLPAMFRGDRFPA